VHASRPSLPFFSYLHSRGRLESGSHVARSPE